MAGKCGNGIITHQPQNAQRVRLHWLSDCKWKQLTKRGLADSGQRFKCIVRRLVIAQASHQLSYLAVRMHNRALKATVSAACLIQLEYSGRDGADCFRSDRRLVSAKQPRPSSPKSALACPATIPL